MLTDYEKALNWLQKTVVKSHDLKFPGEVGLARTRLFLKLLGDPQHDYPVIHVAGTSGKGSTTTFAANLLHSAGLKVGSTVSPHLLDLRERVQINSQLISQKKFTLYLSEMLPSYEQVKSSEFGGPTYFEVMMVLAFYVFSREKVDYAVIETGLGGTFDASNVINRADKICVITRIGKDHTHILGNSLAKISAQKTGIIQEGNTVVTFRQRTVIMQTLATRVNQTRATLRLLSEEGNYGLSNTPIKLGLAGKFQFENAGLAMKAVEIALRNLHMKVEKSVLFDALTSVRFAGRFTETIYKNHKFIVDGAHNPQKLEAFLAALSELYPGQKFIFVVAIKHTKDHNKLLRQIVPLAKHIIATSFYDDTQDFINISAESAKLHRSLERQGFTAVDSLPDYREAIKHAFALTAEASTKPDASPIIVTGSLYLAGKVLAEMANTDR